jgi:hypothetical protein
MAETDPAVCGECGRNPCLATCPAQDWPDTPAPVGATTQTLAPMLRHHLAPGAVITNDG